MKIVVFGFFLFAMSLFSAMNIGLEAWCCTFVAGFSGIVLSVGVCKETLLRWHSKKIAEEVEDKMRYLGICLNARDMILHIIAPKDYKRLEDNHCNVDCLNSDCAAYHFDKDEDTYEQ